MVRPSVATAINTQVTRELVLDSDEAWYVESAPEWVSLDRSEGEGKSELHLTFAEMPHGTESREGEVVFRMRDREYRTRCKVTQYDYAYGEDEVITLQQSARGKGINIVLLCDGFDAKDIQEGKLLDTALEASEHFFGVEPYKSYREYFNVYTAVSVSAESGIGGVNTVVYNRFNTTAKGGVTLGGRNGDSDFEAIRAYACKAPTVDAGNVSESLIIMLPNTSDYGGVCYWFPDGLSVAYCPQSNYGYPLDFRGVVQHEAGGHGFGHLGDEYIYHNAFIDACPCSCCEHELIVDGEYNVNLSLTGKMSEVAWSHLIFHEKYQGVVDIYEGGYMHSRGVFRSEQNSCMNNDIPYYSTICREHIVRRIKGLSGEAFSFEEFVERDVLEAGASTRATTSSYGELPGYVPMGLMHHAPVWAGKQKEDSK